jgi:hypothetical protein
MYNDEFNGVLDELILYTHNITNDTNHLDISKDFSVYDGYQRQDIIKNLTENKIKQGFLKQKLIQLYNNTLVL